MCPFSGIQFDPYWEYIPKAVDYLGITPHSFRYGCDKDKILIYYGIYRIRRHGAHNGGSSDGHDRARGKVRSCIRNTVKIIIAL